MRARWRRQRPINDLVDLYIHRGSARIVLTDRYLWRLTNKRTGAKQHYNEYVDTGIKDVCYRRRAICQRRIRCYRHTGIGLVNHFFDFRHLYKYNDNNYVPRLADNTTFKQDVFRNYREPLFLLPIYIIRIIYVDCIVFARENAVV